MSDTFNWQLKPAPGFPGYQPQPQSQKQTRRVYDSDPASLAPRASPPPDYSNEPYIPPHDRPHTDWATDDWAMQGARGYPGVLPGPFMPQPHEFASLLHGITMGMGRWGSHYSGMPAIAMGTYASAYWKAYQSGMKERSGEAWQQYRQAHQMFLDRQKEELQAAKEGFALYGKDPEKLHQYMMGLVSKYHDSNLENALSQGPAAVDELMKYRDRNWRTAAQINAQQDRRKIQDDILQEHYRDLQERRQREEERRKELERLRKQYDPAAVGPGPDYRPEPLPPAPTLPATEGDAAPAGGDEEGANAGDEAPPAEDTEVPPAGATAEGATAEGAPDETGGSQKPVQVADASGQVPIGGGQTPSPSPARGFGEGLPQGKQEPPEIERAAKNYLFNGGKLPQGVEKNLPDIAGRITGRAGQLKNWLDNLESDPKINPKNISSIVRGVFPTLADKIDGYLAGKLTPSTRANDEEWRRAIALGYRIAPEFSQGTFQSRQQGLAAWTRGERGNNLSSLGIAMDHAETLLGHLENKPGGDLPYGGGIAAEFSRRFGGEKGAAAILDGDVETFAEEYVRAMSGKGPTIPELREEKEKLNLGYPKGYLRGLVLERIHLLQTKLREKQAQFESETGFPATDIMKRFKAFANTDPLATNRDRQGASGLEKLDKWAPSGASQGVPGKENDNAKEGDRKQFKQGWGVFRNGKWVPE